MQLRSSLFTFAAQASVSSKGRHRADQPVLVLKINMDRFLRTLSIRRKKRPKIPDTNGGSHPVSWQEDERKVREGTCSFQVKVSY